MNIIKKNDQMINFYTYYQILDLSKGQQSLISKSIKVLIDNLEKEINNSFRDSSLKFRIHYDIVDNKTANKDHYSDFIKKNNINIVCQTPNYFNCEDWSNYFDNAIYFDSFNMKDIKDQNHKNLLYTNIQQFLTEYKSVKKNIQK